METKKNFHPKVLVFGAGTIGSYYTYKLDNANIDVTLLARRARYEYLKEHSIELIDEFTKKKLTNDFYKLIKKSNVSTPNFDKLSAFVKDYKEISIS